MRCAVTADRHPHHTRQEGQGREGDRGPVGDPRFNDISSLRDLAKHWLLEIETFFATYKTLEGDVPEVSGWGGPAAAWQVIEQARRRAGSS